MGQRTKLAAAVVVITTAAIPAVAAARQSTTTGISMGHGPHVVTLFPQVQSANGPVTTGTVTLTIRNATTRKRVRSFGVTAGQSCWLGHTVHGSRVTFARSTATGADAGVSCKARSFTGPSKDRYTITARFDGTAGLGPSVSNPAAL